MMAATDRPTPDPARTGVDAEPTSPAPGAASQRSDTMAALVAPAYGGSEVLELRQIARPTAGEGEVVVQVAVAGVSRGALHLLTGTPYLLRLAGFGLRRPKHPVGTELAGTVVAVGPGVTRLAVGDEVFGYGKGTGAEYAVAREAKLAIKPPQLPFDQAAAIVDSASTALQAVRDHAGVQAGQRILVLGASGGVGTFAVQIAKDLGASVTGTASTAKLDLVRSLGADEVIDHRAADPLETSEPYDAIIDIGGNRPVRAMRKALTATGTLVIVGGEGGGRLTGGFQRQLLAPLRAIGSDQALKTFVATEDERYLADLAEMVVGGRLRPVIDRVHPLAQGAEAFERMAAGTIRGKDLIDVAGPPAASA